VVIIARSRSTSKFASEAQEAAASGAKERLLPRARRIDVGRPVRGATSSTFQGITSIEKESELA